MPGTGKGCPPGPSCPRWPCRTGRRCDDIAADAGRREGAAVWGESRVLRVSPYGEVDRVVHLPCRQPSSVAIGGEDGTRLLVTSARYGLADPAPADGALWTCDVGVSAPPARAAVLTRYPE
ncbi:SMP-30/gluconolactonase/LRE family protein [Microbispora sp. H10830]|uniref:SMP-30/gluconolactonase/LRE family protein n=1 Tax=Microbispora sp. H10830 TaxID=2729109 RepID=UPI0009DFB288|nr:SMP-30/gluconolactonase/LRE family protein [Microbispora sp. H10830]